LKKERENLELALNEEKRQIAEEAFQQDLEQFSQETKPRSLSGK